MIPAARVIVTDTSPLLTLVLADSLDALLRPRIPVSIPHAVYIEAACVRGAPGAEQIVAWINDHLDQVRIVPTDIGIDQQRRLEEGRSIRGLGEQAAIETLERFLRSSAEGEAILLFEDSDVGRRRAVIDERVSLVSTGDFLRELGGGPAHPVSRLHFGSGGGEGPRRRPPPPASRDLSRQARAGLTQPA